MGPADNIHPGHGKPPVTIFVNTRKFPWTERDISYEQVYDLAWSGGRKPDARTGKLPPVGNTVDVAAARYSNFGQRNCQLQRGHYSKRCDSKHYARQGWL